MVWRGPQYIIICFENNNVNERTHHASTFRIMNVTECYCKIGSEIHPEDRIIINYDTNNHNRAFKEIVNFNEDYKGLPHNIKTYLYLYVFDTGYQNDHNGPQPIQLNFKFSVAVAVVIYHA